MNLFISIHLLSILHLVKCFPSPENLHVSQNTLQNSESKDFIILEENDALLEERTAIIEQPDPNMHLNPALSELEAKLNSLAPKKLGETASDLNAEDVGKLQFQSKFSPDSTSSADFSYKAPLGTVIKEHSELSNTSDNAKSEQAGKSSIHTTGDNYLKKSSNVLIDTPGSVASQHLTNTSSNTLQKVSLDEPSDLSLVTSTVGVPSDESTNSSSDTSVKNLQNTAPALPGSTTILNSSKSNVAPLKILEGRSGILPGTPSASNQSSDTSQTTAKADEKEPSLILPDAPIEASRFNSLMMSDAPADVPVMKFSGLPANQVDDDLLPGEIAKDITPNISPISETLSQKANTAEKYSETSGSIYKPNSDSYIMTSVLEQKLNKTSVPNDTKDQKHEGANIDVQGTSTTNENPMESRINSDQVDKFAPLLAKNSSPPPKEITLPSEAVNAAPQNSNMSKTIGNILSTSSAVKKDNTSAVLTPTTKLSQTETLGKNIIHCVNLNLI